MRSALGFFLSAGLHLAAALAFVVAWPMLRREPVVLPSVPIELLSEAEIAEMIEVPEAMRAEEPELDQPEPEPEPEEVEPEPVPETPPPTPEPEPEPLPEPEPEPEPQPEEPEVVEEPEPEPEEPKVTPPDPEPKPEPEDDPLAGLDDALLDLDPDKQERRQPNEVDEGQGAERDQERVGLGERLLANEEAAVLARMERCWVPLTGAPDASELVVSLRFELTREGALVEPPSVLNDREINRSGNAFWRVARDRAVSAVEDCAPYDFLSEERYSVWREFTMNFYPPGL